MKFENRKLYPHGQNSGVFLLQIPKLICQDMQLTRDSIVDVDYSDNKIIVSLSNKETEKCQEDA